MNRARFFLYTHSPKCLPFHDIYIYIPHLRLICNQFSVSCNSCGRGYSSCEYIRRMLALAGSVVSCTNTVASCQSVSSLELKSCVCCVVTVCTRTFSKELPITAVVFKSGG